MNMSYLHSDIAEDPPLVTSPAIALSGTQPTLLQLLHILEIRISFSSSLVRPIDRRKLNVSLRCARCSLCFIPGRTLLINITRHLILRRPARSIRPISYASRSPDILSSINIVHIINRTYHYWHLSSRPGKVGYVPFIIILTIGSDTISASLICMP